MGNSQLENIREEGGLQFQDELWGGLLTGLSHFLGEPSIEQKNISILKARPLDATRILEHQKLFEEVAQHDEYASRLLEEVRRNPSLMLESAHNRKQLACKKWILESLVQLNLTKLNRMLIVGGWIGVLSALLLRDSRFKINEILSLDIDADAAEVAARLNPNTSFKSVTQNMYDFNYQAYGPDLVINTSCEHIESLPEWLSRIPAESWLVLQSNDYFGVDGHINCHNNLADFVADAGLKTVIYQSELPQKKYTRFMIIGKRSEP